MYNYTRSSTTGAVNHPWASKKTSITSIVIEDGVTSIGSYAFWWCYNVSSVEISDTVTTIGEQSFYDCSKLFKGCF
jgi:hypothetical protein